MKLIFKGWDRHVFTHEIAVAPAWRGGYKYQKGKADEPLSWNANLSAFGAVKNVALSGSFFVEFNFSDQELKSFLSAYISADPEAALRMICAMEAEAFIAVAKKAASE